MRKQDWTWAASIAALAAALIALARGRVGVAIAFAGVAAAGDTAGRRWSRTSPSPMPASQRWVLAMHRPLGALIRALEPLPGERILELGPGLGQQAAQVATMVGTEGQVHVVDVQQEMLDATASRAERHGLHNVGTSLADASGRLPFDDGSFDAAYLSTVLGEIPNQEGTLRELGRVLRTGGRIVVAEEAIDPDFIPSARLRTLGEAAGLHFDRRFGPPFHYRARFTNP